MVQLSVCCDEARACPLKKLEDPRPQLTLTQCTHKIPVISLIVECIVNDTTRSVPQICDLCLRQRPIAVLPEASPPNCLPPASLCNNPLYDHTFPGCGARPFVVGKREPSLRVHVRSCRGRRGGCTNARVRKPFKVVFLWARNHLRVYVLREGKRSVGGTTR